MAATTLVVCNPNAAGQARGFVFPGEVVEVRLAVEGDAERSDEQLKELEEKHLYVASLEPVPAGRGGVSGEDGAAAATTSGSGAAFADTLEVSAINGSLQESGGGSNVSGIARRLTKCWQEEGGDEGAKTTHICLEASIPSRFPSSPCTAALLQVKQFLRYPLGSNAGATDAATTQQGGEELFEYFLCRTWTKEVQVLRPLKVESFVSQRSESAEEAFLSVTVGNILPPSGDTSGCVLSLQNFQLLSDPPQLLSISQIYPAKQPGTTHYQDVSPGTEYTFALRVCFNEEAGEQTQRSSASGSGSGRSVIPVDLLLSVATNVSSSQLVFIHHTEVARHAQPVVQMEITQQEGSSSLQCQIKGGAAKGGALEDRLNHPKAPFPSSRFKKLIFEEKGDRAVECNLSSNANGTATCNLMPSNSGLLRYFDLTLVDDKNKTFKAKCILNSN